MATTTIKAIGNAIGGSDSVEALIFDYSAASTKSVTLAGADNALMSNASDEHELFVGSTGRNIAPNYTFEDTTQKWSVFSASNYQLVSDYKAEESLPATYTATLPATLVYDKGKAKVTVTAAYTETSLTPSTLASTVTLVDATRVTLPIAITGGTKATTINISKNGGTLMGGSTAADKLYGNTGADVFVYSVGGGADVVGDTKNKDTLYKANDKIVIISSDAASDPEGYLGFKDAKSALTLTFKGNKQSKLTINKDNAETPVTIELRSEVNGSVIKTITHNSTVEGVSLTNNSTTAVVSAAVASGETVDAAKMNSQIKIINASAAPVPTYLIGNTQATTITLGSGGGTAKGGYDYVNDKGFDDKFYAGAGADVFVYSIGGGKDQIYYFNGKTDKIVLQGAEFSNLSTIPATGDISYAEKSSNLVLTLNGSNGKKGTLTLNNPLGEVKIYKESDLNNPILESGVDLPDYTGYNKNKTAVTLGAAADESTAAASKTISIDLLGDGYSNSIKEIDASAFVGEVNLVGNGSANAIKSAIGGGTLDGGSGTKATGDKLYGNVGADVFIYKLTSVGGGTDIIGGDTKLPEGNFETQDKIYITRGEGLTEDDITITDKNNTMTLKFSNDAKSQLTINRASSDTAVNFYLGAAEANLSALSVAFTHGSLPSGAGYGQKSGKLDYTSLTIGGAAANSTIDTNNIHSQIKNIDMSGQTAGAVYLVGNAAANNITLGSSGGTVDGGKGNDKIFGNATASGGTTFVYTVGEGNDELNGYNGSKDTIFISGYSKTIDTANTKMFKDSGKDITVTFTETTKGKLTIKSTTGKLTIVGKDDNNAVVTLLSYGENLPDSVNMGFNANKTIMTIGGGADLGTTDKFKLNDYGINLKELDASAYSTKELYLIGSNAKASILRAGSKGSTLEGASSGADKLYGNSGTDSFVYSVSGGGKDEIYSLDGAQGDEIILLGYEKGSIDTSKTSEFADSGKDITLSFTGGGKLVVKNPVGQLNVYSGTRDTLTGAITKSANAVLNYDANLPAGIEYNVGKTAIKFGSSIAGGETTYSIDASKDNAYSIKLKTIDASDYSGSVSLVGNDQANVLYSGKSASTLDGGEGADKLYGKSGVKDTFVYNNDGSKDIVYDYNYTQDGDLIKVNSSSVEVTYNGKTVVLTCKDGGKTGTLTINGVQTGTNKFAAIDTTTKVAIQIGEDEVKTYIFQSNKIKNVALDKITADDKILVNQDPTTSTSTTVAQLSSESVDEYWFTQANYAPDDLSATDELDSLMEIKPLASDAVSLDDFAEINKKINQELSSNAITRHKLKK